MSGLQPDDRGPRQRRGPGPTVPGHARPPRSCFLDEPCAHRECLHERLRKGTSTFSTTGSGQRPSWVDAADYGVVSRPRLWWIRADCSRRTEFKWSKSGRTHKLHIPGPRDDWSSYDMRGHQCSKEVAMLRRNRARDSESMARGLQDLRAVALSGGRALQGSLRQARDHSDFPEGAGPPLKARLHAARQLRGT